MVGLRWSAWPGLPVVCENCSYTFLTLPEQLCEMLSILSCYISKLVNVLILAKDGRSYFN